MKRLQAWLQLVRVPNLPGSAANVLTGYLLVASQWAPGPAVVGAAIVSVLLYAAGVVGNDLADREQDRQRNPGRPLPSGQVGERTAMIAVWVLSGGALAGALLLVNRKLPGGPGAAPLVVALGLLVSIVIYNWLLKRWLVSALFMGICRGLNVLLGASAAWAWSDSLFPARGWTVGLACLSITLFVAGITLLARDETAGRPRRGVMIAGLMAQAAGLAGYLALPWALLADGTGPLGMGGRNHMLLTGLIGVTVLRRGMLAAVSLTPAAIRTAVILSLASLTTLDAAVALLATGAPQHALVILGLFGLGLGLRTLASPT